MSFGSAFITSIHYILQVRATGSVPWCSSPPHPFLRSASPLLRYLDRSVSLSISASCFPCIQNLVEKRAGFPLLFLLKISLLASGCKGQNENKNKTPKPKKSLSIGSVAIVKEERFTWNQKKEGCFSKFLKLCMERNVCFWLGLKELECVQPGNSASEAISLIN